MVHRLIALLLTLAAALALAAGCDESGTNEDQSSSPSPALAASFTPESDIPNIHPMLNYAKLRLGMGGIEISQAYNAPDGRGEGFTRVYEQYGSSTNHIIAFADDGSGVKRTMTLAVYRDELFLIVDRREGMDSAGAEAWLAELMEMYEDEPLETIGGAQWIWESPEGIKAAFTRDNASEDYMNCTFVLEHEPTREAWHAYNEEWENRHPQD